MQSNDNNHSVLENHHRSNLFLSMVCWHSPHRLCPLRLNHSRGFCCVVDRNIFISWYDFPCDMRKKSKLQKVIAGRRMIVTPCAILLILSSSIIWYEVIHFRYFSVSDYVHQTALNLFSQEKKANKKKQFVYVYGTRNLFVVVCHLKSESKRCEEQIKKWINKAKEGNYVNPTCWWYGWQSEQNAFDSSRCVSICRWSMWKIELLISQLARYYPPYSCIYLHDFDMWNYVGLWTLVFGHDYAVAYCHCIFSMTFRKLRSKTNKAFNKYE